MLDGEDGNFSRCGGLSILYEDFASLHRTSVGVGGDGGCVSMRSVGQGGKSREQSAKSSSVEWLS